MMHSRRDFGKIALAGLPLSMALAKIDSKINGVQLGVQTYSFRELPQENIIDTVIKAMTDVGLGMCELYSAQIEPGKQAREDLRKWRLSVSMDHFKNVRKKFDAAGINLYAYNLSFNDSFTDEEIERGFEMAKALGVKAITASTTLKVAKRVAPFADKHKTIVAMHGHSNVKDPNEFSTPESFQAAMDMTKYFWVNLDIGHFFAAGYDPVAYLKEHHDRISNLHLKDRKKEQGPNMPWGQGDTPIKEVLLVLKEKKYPVPAFIEYEYKGTDGPVAEVKKCYQYAKDALA